MKSACFLLDFFFLSFVFSIFHFSLPGRILIRSKMAKDPAEERETGKILRGEGQQNLYCGKQLRAEGLQNL